jgi:hypothetical protein
MEERQTRERRRAIGRISDYWRGRVAVHLCDRSLVTELAWKAMFLRLVEDVAFVQGEIGRIGDPPDDIGFDPREPLVWTWCVLDTMPNDHAQRYQGLRERAADGSGIEDRSDMLRQHGYRMAGLPTAINLQVPWLAGLARLLDDDLAGLQYWPEDVAGWTSDEWRPPGYGCFVVPVRRDYRLADGRPAQRRGLRHHAVIPERIGSLAVEIHLHPDVAVRDVGADPVNWTFGAATFPEMTVVTVSTGVGGFRLADAPANGDEAALVARQVEGAREAGVDILIWPELTMPLRRLELLRARLADAPLSGGRIPLVVAGSWHVLREAAFDVPEGPEVEAGGGAEQYVNRSEVMLGYGEFLLSYDKRRRFPFGGMMEDIHAGRKLPVIVMEDRLVGIAICRDNCDDTATETYGDLPLDLVIVPSMGAESTVEAHERHAKGQRSRQGTVTVVVQQNLAVDGAPPPPGPVAFSFVRPREGDGAPLHQTESFRTLGRSLKKVS